jgi:endonuclease/exonuclease/phosphatase (EEP) superfamily protein YafD
MESSGNGKNRLVAWLGWLSYAYGLSIVGLCLVMYLAGDRWWPATLIMFGPRWLWGLPLVVLTPAAAVSRRPWLLALLTSTGVVFLILIMNLCLPWQSWLGHSCIGPTIRVLTCNVHHGDLNAGALKTLLEVTQPDIVALQGWSSRHGAVFDSGEWHVQRDRHLCLASHFVIERTRVLDDAEFRVAESGLAIYELATPVGLIQVVNLHLESPRDGLEQVIQSRGLRTDRLEDNCEFRRRQSARASQRLEGTQEPLLIMGDFNTPPESTIYREYWSPYENAFASAGWGFGRTHFTRHTAVRIDHLLAGPGWRCRKAWVGPPVGSPHRPVLADWCRTSAE